MFSGYEVSVWDDWKILEKASDDGNALNATQLHTFEKWLKW